MPVFFCFREVLEPTLNGDFRRFSTWRPANSCYDPAVT